MKTTNAQVKDRKLSVVGRKSKPKIESAEMQSRIAETAYYKAQARGFQPGHELEDWLAAEKENQ